MSAVPICEQFSSSGVAEVEDNLEHPVHAEDIHGYAALGPVSDMVLLPYQ